MNKKFMVFLVLTMVSMTGLAQDGQRMGKMKKMVQQLNLDEKQMVEFKNFKKQNKGAMKALRQKRKELTEKLKNQFINNASDSELTAIHGEIKSTQQQLADQKLKKMLFLKKTLNQKQRQQFMEMRKSFRDGRDG